MPLKRAGTRYKGLCPFHSEKTPSFTVDADKGFFYCFGCQAGGDAFKFLELHEKVGFQDAVRMLAQKFGVAIPADTDSTPEDARRDAALRERLLKVHEVAAAFFREQLAGPAGARARRQLADRGVSAETVAALGLGAAPARAGCPEEPAARAGIHHRRIAAERPGPAARQRRRRRSVSQSADGSDLPRHRVGDRLWRPGDGRRAGAEVSEFARDADLLEGANAVRPQPVKSIGQAARLRRPGGRLLRFRAGISDTGGAGRRVLRHGADASRKRSCCGDSRPESCSATTRMPPDRVPRRGRASCWSPRGSTSTWLCWTRAKIPIHTSGGTGRTDIVRNCAIRGHIWNICSNRRRRVWTSARTTAGGSFSGIDAARSPPVSPIRPRGISLATGCP